MADRRSLQRRCTELKRAGLIPKDFSCGSSNEVLRAEIARVDARPIVGTRPELAGLPNDLVNVISSYATTKVTFDLITLSADNWRPIYSNSLWKQKLQYETQGLLIDETAINANKGSSSNVWWRYYLAKNRTFWGPALYTWSRPADTTVTPVALPGPVLAAGFMVRGRSNDPHENSYLIFQLTDLRLAIRIGPRQRDIWYLDFPERIRRFLRIVSHPGVLIVTERGNIYLLYSTPIADPEGFEFRQIDLGGINLVSIVEDLDFESSEPVVYALERNGSVEFCELSFSNRILRSLPAILNGVPRIVELADNFSAPAALLGDGTIVYLESNYEDQPTGKVIKIDIIGHSEYFGIYDSIGPDHISGISAYGPNPGEERGDVAASADTTDTRFLVLGNRNTEYSRVDARVRRMITGPKRRELVLLPGTEYRTQYVTTHRRHGLIIVD